jgi:hypothetical protein
MIQLFFGFRLQQSTLVILLWFVGDPRSTVSWLVCATLENIRITTDILFLLLPSSSYGSQIKIVGLCDCN